MTQFPKHIQNAVDLGLLTAADGKITGVGQEEAQSVFGLVRLIEKIQPTTKFEGDDTRDQGRRGARTGSPSDPLWRFL